VSAGRVGGGGGVCGGVGVAQGPAHLVRSDGQVEKVAVPLPRAVGRPALVPHVGWGRRLHHAQPNQAEGWASLNELHHRLGAPTGLRALPRRQGAGSPQDHRLVYLLGRQYGGLLPVDKVWRGPHPPDWGGWGWRGGRPGPCGRSAGPGGLRADTHVAPSLTKIRCNWPWVDCGGLGRSWAGVSAGGRGRPGEGGQQQKSTPPTTAS
jgi:hypothetical protein